MRQAVVDVTNFERTLTELGITGELSGKQMEAVKKQVMGLSSLTLQSPTEQLEAFKSMVAAGIEPKKVTSGLEAIDKAATASMSNINDLGLAVVQLYQKMDIKPEKLERALNIMAVAGKAGAFEMKDMAQYFPEVLAASSQYGITGERGTAQVAAMLQIARRNRGTSAEAATDMKGFFSKLVAYRKEFKKVDVDVLDFVDLKTGRFREGKDIDQFFEVLRNKTNGGSAAMLKTIGIQDYEASNFMAGMMKDWPDYKKIRDEALSGADKGVVNKDFDTVMNTDFAKLKLLQIEREKAMMSPASTKFTHGALSAGNWAIEHPLTTGGIAAGGYTGFKLLQRFLGGKSFGEIGEIAKNGGRLSGLGKTAKTAKEAAELYRATGGLFGAPLPAAAASPFAAGIAAIPAIGTGIAGYTSISIGKQLAQNEALISSTERLIELRNRHVVMGGGPNSFQVQLIDKQLQQRAAALPPYGEPRNDIILNINIDGNGRSSVESKDMQTRATINFNNRGRFLGGDKPLMKSH
jgi:TP901 family phage tail tape measure protein